MSTRMNRGADGRVTILFDRFVSGAQVADLNDHHAASTDRGGRFDWFQDDGAWYITDEPLNDDAVQEVLNTLHAVLEIGMITFYDADGTIKYFSMYAKPQPYADEVPQTDASEADADPELAKLQAYAAREAAQTAVLTGEGTQAALDAAQAVYESILLPGNKNVFVPWTDTGIPFACDCGEIIFADTEHNH